MEERNEFTPGPWKAFDVSEMHDEPRFMVGPREFCSIAEVRAGSTEAEETGDVAANARLIAAAPALYEALHDLVHGRISDSAKATEATRQRRRDAWENAKAALLLANTGETENG